MKIISRECVAVPFFTGNIKREFAAAVEYDHEDDGNEEESGKVRVLSYVFTHAAESGRGASPLHCINAGECISGGEEEEEEKKEARVSRISYTYKRAEDSRRGGNVATMCDAGGERAEVSFSRFSCAAPRHGMVHTSVHPLSPSPSSSPCYRAHGRCTHIHDT